MEQDFTKLAAAAIRELRDDNVKLAKNLKLQDEAIKLAFVLYEQGLVMTEDLQDKIHELQQKTENELEVIKQASEFNKIANNHTSFRLSNGHADNGTLDPLTRMLLEDYI